jgi:hypothetical protein
LESWRGEESSGAVFHHALVKKDDQKAKKTARRHGGELVFLGCSATELYIALSLKQPRQKDKN